MPTLFQIKSYLSYWLNAVDRHSLHSPFFFDFYTNVVNKNRVGDFESYERLRATLQNSNQSVSVTDPGAGSKHLKHNTRLIRTIANTSLSSKKYSILYSNIIGNYKLKSIIELGTSFGINTLYLSNNENARVTTFEGSKPIAEIARSTFEFASVNNIELIEGNIDTTLQNFLQSIQKIDFAFIDANHTYEATIRYFELLVRKTHQKTVIVIDDVHYTKGMDKAWREIKQHKLVYASVDLFRCGILFFDPSLNKQHVILQF